MPDLTRPDLANNTTLDASSLDRAALSALKVGTRVTNVNGTASVWKVVRPGVMKRISAEEPSDA